jgi:hypothetical protein
MEETKREKGETADEKEKIGGFVDLPSCFPFWRKHQMPASKPNTI